MAVLEGDEVKERPGVQSPRFKARLAGALYLLTFVTGGLAAAFTGRAVPYGVAASLLATVCYIGVTLLFYDIFKPVDRRVSLVAACFSIVGAAVGTLDLVHLAPFGLNSLVLFGFYCLLIGYLILRSTFLPRILGALMALAGVGWLTFLSPTLAHTVSPYNVAAGLLGEGSLTLWLLVFGINVRRWEASASH